MSSEKTEEFRKVKKKECPGCAVDVSKDAEVCPICGYEFPKQSLSMKILAWALIFLLLIWYFF